MPTHLFKTRFVITDTDGTNETVPYELHVGSEAIGNDQDSHCEECEEKGR